MTGQAAAPTIAPHHCTGLGDTLEGRVLKEKLERAYPPNERSKIEEAVRKQLMMSTNLSQHKCDDVPLRFLLVHPNKEV